MFNFKSVAVLFLLTIVLIGCQNSQLNLSGNVTSIEVTDWDNEELVSTISDEEFINELIVELESAVVGSTSGMDFASPDYKLSFKNNEETIYELGYYNEVMQLSVEGSYWSFNEQLMYQLLMPLPVEG
ncbi:hypothetical protein QGM71_19775 [Virgibacillus sp. C22-A2]|uniref:Uncharacterized protein n=1 Tax=Virgibacillus tibetensis TaxID=3042313 RepID=A0ABU6KK78_9BACI|nr:hypothetical protein [Virgibacillus sp. C22-A2]